FLAGGLLMGVGLFIRVRILESPVFLETKRAPSQKLPVVEVLRAQPRTVLLAMGARMAENVSFYLFTGFILSYATEQLELPRDTVLQGVLLAAVCQLATIPWCGLLSDRWGRRRVYLFGAVGMGLYAWPFFWLADTGGVAALWLGLAVGLAVFHAAM